MLVCRTQLFIIIYNPKYNDILSNLFLVIHNIKI